MNGLLSILTIKANQRRCARRKIDLVATNSANSVHARFTRKRPMSRRCGNDPVVGRRKASLKEGNKTMNKLLLAAGALLLATTAVPASAHDPNSDNTYSYNPYDNGSGSNRYDNGHGSNQYGNGYGYDRGYSGYDSRNREQLRVCLKHQRVHQKLAALHDRTHDQSYYDGADHSNAHDYIDARHEQWHRDHPGADDCRYWQGLVNSGRGGYYDRSDRNGSFSFSFGR